MVKMPVSVDCIVLLDHILGLHRKNTCVFSCLILTIISLQHTLRQQRFMRHAQLLVHTTSDPACHSILSSQPTYDVIGATLPHACHYVLSSP